MGTPRYASISAHKGRNQTPSDDIESLLYNLVFMCRKDLPWINTKTVGGNKLDAILTVKLKKTKAELCKDLPKCFLQTFEYLHTLKPEEHINYAYLIGLFKESSVSKTEIKSESQAHSETEEQEPARNAKPVKKDHRRPSI